MLLIPDVGEGEDYATIGVRASRGHVEGRWIGVGREIGEVVEVLRPLSGSVSEAVQRRYVGAALEEVPGRAG